MRFLLTGIAGCVLVGSSMVHADVIEGSSDADFIDVGVDLELLSGGVNVNANISGLAPASGTAPPTYSQNVPVLDINASSGTNLLFDTLVGVQSASVVSNVFSDIDGLSGARTVNATHTIEDLDLSIVDLLLGPDLISITADALSVTSALSGDFGAIVATSTMTVTNLQIFVSGVQVGATLNGTIVANTGISLNTVLGGATLLLHDQVITTTNGQPTDIVANGIRLQLNDVGVTGIGIINGGVSVAMTHSEISAAAVPEPTSLALLSSVGLLLGYTHCRSRKRRNLLVSHQPA